MFSDMDIRRRHKRLFWCAGVSWALPVGEIPTQARSEAAPPEIESWVCEGNDAD